MNAANIHLTPYSGREELTYMSQTETITNIMDLFRQDCSCKKKNSKNGVNLQL